MDHAAVPRTPASSRLADIENIIRDMVARASILSRSLSRLQPSRRQQLSKYAAISIGSVVGTSAASGGTCGEVVVPGTASQAVVQKSATGCCTVGSKPGDDVATSFSSQLDSTTHSHDHITTPQPVTLPPSASPSSLSTSPIKGTFSTRHRTRTQSYFHCNRTQLHCHGHNGYAVDSCLREKARRRQDRGCVSCFCVADSVS